MFEKAGIPVLPVHLMKQTQVKPKYLQVSAQIMQFSFDYIKKTSKLNQQTHA